MTTLFLILAALLASVVYAMSGVEHGLIYYWHRVFAKAQKGYLAPLKPKILEWWDQDIHRSGHLMHYSLAAALFLAAARPGEWQGYAAASLFAYAPFAIGSPFRQKFINAGSDGGGSPKWWKPVLGAIALVGCVLLERGVI